jgi:hypothetical protein
MEMFMCMTMNSDKSPLLPPVRIGEIVWSFDYDTQMKVPVKVTKVYEDGNWDGVGAWTWGWA